MKIHEKNDRPVDRPEHPPRATAPAERRSDQHDPRDWSAAADDDANETFRPTDSGFGNFP